MASSSAVRRVVGVVGNDAALHPNRLLRALPHDDYRRLAGALRPTPLRFRDVLQRQHEPIRWIYFPHGGVVSVITLTRDGRMVEAATVGHEGMVDVSAFLGARRALHEIIVQVPGIGADALPVEVFRDEIARNGAFADIVGRYSQAFLALVTQSIACNGLHSVEQRCCRWLLMTADRTHDPDFALTQEFLAVMLGVRRASVHDVVKRLERRHLIHYYRRRVRILDRPGLEALACECYGVVRAQFRRLLR